MAGPALVVVLCVVLGLGLLLATVLGRWRGPVRWAALVGVLVAAAPVLLVAAFLAGQPEPLEPDETLAIGVRVDDGAARIWLGPTCEEVEELQVTLKVQGAPGNDVLRLRATGPAVSVEQLGLTPDTYPAGMEAEEPLAPESLDLDRHRSLDVLERRATGVLLAPAIDGSAEHPDRFWFGERVGWLTPEEAADRVGAGRLSTVCDPVPEGTYGG